MFKKSWPESEKLPPTTAALKQHIKCAHYQAMIWHNDHNPKPNLPSPEYHGWTKENNSYIPVIEILHQLHKLSWSWLAVNALNPSAEQMLVPANMHMLCAQKCVAVKPMKTCVRTDNNHKLRTAMTQTVMK